MVLIVQGIGLRPETLTLAVAGFVLAIPWLAVRPRPQWLVLDVCHPAAALRPCSAAIPALDENLWHCRVNPGDVVGVAGDDGVTTLPGAEHDVYVNYVVMVSVRAHRPDAPRHTQRHDRDVDAGRLEQPGETSLARTAPRLCDDFGPGCR